MSSSKIPSVKKLRIAYLRINQETHALSPVDTVMDDFRRDHFKEGHELATSCARGGVEVEGFGKNMELSGFVRACAAHDTDVETVPLFSAWTSPNGPVSDATVGEFEAMIVDALENAGELDGVFFSLHGAMGARSIVDPETRFLAAVRSVIGTKPIAVTYDLHANLTKERVALTDVIVAYKTNPHRDHAAVGAQAGTLLIDTILERFVPTTAWRSLPMIIGGGTTIDFLMPMRAIYKRCRAMEKDPRVKAASVLMCHPWNNNPALGWSVVVVTDGDAALANRLSDELADLCWNVRDQLPPTFATPEAGIEKARSMKLRRRLGVITMSDASDVTSAGAPGDSPKIVDALLRHGKGMVSYAGIRDPIAIETLWTKNVDDEVTITVGGTLSNTEGLEVSGRVIHKAKQKAFERCVVLDLGHVKLVVCEGPALIIKPEFYKGTGLNMWKADIVVVKNFFPFLLFFAPYHRWTIFVKTGGLTDFDAAHVLNFDGPVHPRDDVTEWRSRDALRRRDDALGRETGRRAA